jgi:hypothetical protein
VRRAACLVLGVIVLAGCGGGGGGGDRLSRSEYAAKADAICRKSNEATSSVGRPKDLAGLAKAFDQALPVLDRALKQLHALKPPKSEQHTVDEWLAQSEVLRHDLREMRDQARANNAKGVQEAFARAQANDKQGNQLAAKLGLKVCSTG